MSVPSLANPHFILRISNAKTFKKKYARCPESEEERRILPFVACGTLKTDKGKYRLSRL